jgi:hypothetical protein
VVRQELGAEDDAKENEHEELDGCNGCRDDRCRAPGGLDCLPSVDVIHGAL